MKLYKVALCVLLLPVFAGGVCAQTVVYTNNDVSSSAIGDIAGASGALAAAIAHRSATVGSSVQVTGNSVSAFLVGAGGTLTPVAGSPFATGGSGCGGGFVAANRIVVAGGFLFASDCGTGDVAAFTINAATGVLTPVAGSPFAASGTTGDDISLAVTPNLRFLIAASVASSNAVVFSIAGSGALTPVAGSPFALGSIFPDGVKVTPDGRFLAVAFAGTNSVGMYSISASGALTAVTGSPFAGSGGAAVEAGIEINGASSLVFVPRATPGFTNVDVFSIGPSGALTKVAGSPFVFASGLNSNVGVLSPDERFLFVSNQDSNTVTVLNVAGGGALSLVPGSPFANPGGGVPSPSGLVVNQAGTYLYGANFADSSVSGLTIASGGALASVSGSPFFTSSPSFSGLMSIAIFPRTVTNSACLHHTVHGHLDTTVPVHTGNQDVHHGQHGHTVVAGQPLCGHNPIPSHSGLMPDPGEGLFAPSALAESPTFVAGLDQDGSLNSQVSAPRGTVVALFGSAEGLYLDEQDRQPASEFTPPPSGSPLYYTTSLPDVRIGGVPAKVLFSGLAPGLKGAWQINVLIPEDASAGEAPVTINYEGDALTSVAIAVK